MKPRTSLFYQYAKPLVLVGLGLISLGQAKAGAVSLQWGTATYSQAGASPTGSINGTTTGNDGWAISRSDSSTTAETAVFETAADVGFFSGTTLTFTLRQNSGLLNHTIGRFRLSVTTDDRSTFADGFNFFGDVTANWTVLDPSSFISANGATLTKQGDLSILASGTNPETDTYTITAQTSLTGITGIRLEVMADASLPTDGPGRASSGNFKLTEIELTAESSAVPLIAGLIAWWPAENAVGEIVGGAHVAVASGSQTYTQGKVGRAFSFNGIDQSLNTTATTDVLNQVPLTIEGWVKPGARATGSISAPLPTNVISNDRVNFGGHGFGIHIYPDGSKLNIGVQGVEADFRDIPGVTFVPDEWVHVAVVYTTGEAKTYVNGQLSDTFTYTQAAMEGDPVVRIGRHNDDTGYGTRRFFKGAIDELSLYNRALTLDEISAIHAAAASGKTRFDAGNQFTLVFPQTANRVWTYGWLPSGAINTANFTLHDRLSTGGTFVVEIDRWRTLSGSAVAHNHSDNSVISFSASEIHHAPKQIVMEPSTTGNGHRSVVRWKSPKTGRYAISGTFTDIDTEATLSKSVSVYHNNVELFTGNVSGFLGNGTSSTQTRDLTVGDTVDFIVGEGSDGFDSDSTGLVASVVELGAPIAPGTIAFSSATTTVNEKSGLANLTLVRTNGSSGDVSVLVNSSAGTATASDFGVLTNALVTFADGETSKVLSVAITADTFSESGESFSLTLSNPAGGASLGAQASSTVTIVETPDTTPPTLDIPFVWAQKAGAAHAFHLLLDPRDDVGIQKIQVRSKINSTASLPDSTPWVDSPWQNGEPLVVTFKCNSIVIEVRALDAAGNASSLQRRIFASPIPISTAPNLSAKIIAKSALSGGEIDCRGLFGADFDGDGKDDILQLDRTTGAVNVRRQNLDGTFTVNGFNVAAGAIQDSAIGDLDGDGRPDLVMVIDDALAVYHNDGLNGSNVLQFSLMSIDALQLTGLSTIAHVTVGDLTGDDLPEIVVTGMGESSPAVPVAMLAVLVNKPDSLLQTATQAVAYPTSSAGAVKLGDVTGDGWADAVMADAANHQVLLFINKTDGSFGGADDATPEARPQPTVIGGSASVPHALAVGDITGDGRAEAVVTIHDWVSQGATGYNTHSWKVLGSRGTAAMQVAQVTPSRTTGADQSAQTAFLSDVILDDLTGDGRPEVIVTEPFFVNGEVTDNVFGGISFYSIMGSLDNANQLVAYTHTTYNYLTGASNPHRLATGQYSTPDKRQIVLASGQPIPMQLITTQYTSSTKQYDIIGSAWTDKDTRGSAGVNGTRTYFTKIGDVIHYKLTYVNNSDTALTGAIISCLVPTSLAILPSSDAGYTFDTKTKFIQWTVNIPAGQSGTKQFDVRVLSGKPDSVLNTLTGSLRSGTLKIPYVMPFVTLEEPLRLALTTTSDSDSFVGARAHVGEVITYRMRLINDATSALTGVKLSMGIPQNTTLNGGTSPPLPVLGGKFPNYTSVTWTNLTLQPDVPMFLEVRVQVKPTVPDLTVITNGTVMATRSDGQTVVPPKALTTIQPPLEITLTSNKNIVRPGEIIRYTFTAKNWLKSPVTNARVVNQLPIGTALFTAAVNDNTDAPNGAGNFAYSSGTRTAAQLSPTTLPAFDRSTGIMTWVLGTVPAEAQRSIEFDVIVKQDIPTFANIGGISTTLEVQNRTFNFVGTTSANVRLFAAKPLGAAAASSATAASALLLSNLQPPRRSLLSDPPLTPPQLSLHKSVAGDGGVITLAGEGIATVVNDSSVSTDGFVDYILEFKNEKVKVSDPTPGPGIGVVIRDYLPPGMTFTGFVDRDDTRVTSFIGYRFYTANLTEMPVIGAEGFTDTNGNGFYDVGEVYTDTNKNKKYDGVTAALVRSIDFPVGDLSGGASGNFKYQAQAAALPGLVITSSAGGVTGVKNGLDYTKPAGFHMVADNLHFPVSGNPANVKVLVIGIPVLGFPFDPQKSRAEMVGTEPTEIAIPFKIIGASSLSLSGVKMTLTIPKGYQVARALLRDDTTPLPQTRAATITRNKSTGVTTVSFPINDWQYAEAIFQVQLDPINKSALKKNGAIVAPLRIEPTLTGNYLKAAVPPKTIPTVVALKPVTRLLATLPVRDSTAPPPPVAMRASTSIAPPPPAPPTFSDAKIFVGRCAPVSVKRGDTFSYTIFVGNLTNLGLGTGSIEMNVPDGCDYVGASLYKWNAGDSAGVSDESGGTWNKPPTRSGKKVIWSVGSFFPLEGGAVTLTVRVRDDFSGTRIDDNSCTFDVVNASGKTAGPLGVVVRAGNETTQSAQIVQSAVEGLQAEYNDNVRSAMAQTFALSGASCFITCGGADLLQINNGTAVIQLKDGRVMAIGPPDKILASGIRLVKSDAMLRVAVGPGDGNGVELTKLPTFAPGFVQSSNALLAGLHFKAGSIISAEGANLVAAGAGNLVDPAVGNLIGQDGSTLVGNDGASLIGQDGSTFTPVLDVIGQNGASLIGQDGGSLVAAGAGNLVAAGAGNLVAVGAGNLIGQDGSTFAPPPGSFGLLSVDSNNDPTGIIGAGAGRLVGQDGATVITAGGGNLFSTHTGNLIQTNGVVTSPNK
jgi:uncharacterized repeat protein (TIGR01451 family)